MNKPIREGFQPEPPAAADKKQLPGPSTESTPAEAAEEWPIVVELRHGPIRLDQHHPEITSLSLRHPTAGDINYCGSPITMGPNGIFIIEERKMSAMMSRLSGTLPPVLDKLDSRDWSTIAYRLFRFFLPSAVAPE
jgi:hypothetical protein